MLVIRLRRGGKKHEPHYRIVVQEQRSKLNGKYIDSFGHYHPLIKDANKNLIVDKEKALEWITKGAICSTTVNNLLVKAGVLGADKKISRVFSNKKKSAKQNAEKAENAENAVNKPVEKSEVNPEVNPEEEGVENVKESLENIKSEEINHQDTEVEEKTEIKSEHNNQSESVDEPKEKDQE